MAEKVIQEGQDVGDFNIQMDGEEYYVNSIRDLKKYVAKSKNPNTERKTKATIRKFKDFVLSEGFKSDKIEDFDTTQLDALIGKWLLNCKKENNEQYEPDTLTSFHRCIDRYLVEENYPHSIITSPLFDTSRKVRLKVFLII